MTGNAVKRKSLIIFLLFYIFFTFIALFPGHKTLWKNIWNIPTASRFSDARFLTLGSEYHAQGYDPLYDTPRHDNKHLLNYPRIWHLLFALGITQKHTNMIGSIFVMLFFAGIGFFLYSKKIDNVTLWLLAAALLSPAVMLGIERGNTDLTIFFIVSLALSFTTPSLVPRLSCFLFASVLKIYPFFGLIYFFRERKRKFWTIMSVAAIVFGCYLIYSFDDLKQISIATPRNALLSYGTNVFWMGLIHNMVFNIEMSSHEIVTVRALSYALVFVIAVAAFLFSFRTYKANDFRQGEFIDAFRTGAGIYLGTFMLGNNYDYRLMFLIFTIPQLVSWSRKQFIQYPYAPALTLSCIVLSMWSLEIKRILGIQIAFVFSEMFNWMVFAGLFYLLLASLPEWFRESRGWQLSRRWLSNR